MTLTLEDKCAAKVESDMVIFEFDLLMIRAPSTVLVTCTKPISKVALSTQNS